MERTTSSKKHCCTHGGLRKNHRWEPLCSHCKHRQRKTDDPNSNSILQRFFDAAFNTSLNGGYFSDIDGVVTQWQVDGSGSNALLQWIQTLREQDLVPLKTTDFDWWKNVYKQSTAPLCFTCVPPLSLPSKILRNKPTSPRGSSMEHCFWEHEKVKRSNSMLLRPCGYAAHGFKKSRVEQIF